MQSEAENAANANRRERYALLLKARRLTYDHAVTGCLLHPVTVSEPVAVTYSTAAARANLRNVQTCKSVWACPVCADRVTKFRAAELMSALEAWAKSGNTVALATYTLGHKSDESCAGVLDRLMRAYNRFKSGKTHQSMKKTHGVAGSIRALEVTHGVNGWHWHIHEIYVLRGKDAERYRPMLAAMRTHWLKMVKATGGYAVPKGFDLKREKQAAFDYIVKFGKGGQGETWNVARELVRAPAKRRAKSAEGLHPFGLLANADNRRADRVFWNEYVQATKGKLQLRYSRGLKELLGIGEKSDDEVIEADAATDDRVLIYIPVRGWYLLNMRDESIVNEFWQVAHTGDAELLRAWLDNQDIDTISPVT